MIRTYLHRCSANMGKQTKLESVLGAYRTFAEQVAAWQWQIIEEGGQFNKDTPIKHIPSLLSARYKQTAQYQVVGTLNSYLENRKNDFISIVRKSSLSEDVTIELFYINKYNHWYANGLLMKGKPVSSHSLKLARKIFKRLLNKNRKPSFKHCNMVLDTKVASIKKANKGCYPYWLKLSTLEKGKPIYLPLIKNSYFEEQEGVDKKVVQLNFNINNHLEFIGLVKDIPDHKADYRPKLDKLGIDLGLCTLVATDQGDLMGQNWLNHLIKYDHNITELARNLQKQGIKPNQSKRYRSLTSKVRAWIKNEVNRIINRLITIHNPSEIVIERLDFRSSRLSKRLNRIINKFGKGVFKKKLDTLTETFGILITEINPAYTSQECICGYVDKRNRPKQDTFKCKICKTEYHADIKSGKIILGRSKDKQLSNLTIRKVDLLDTLVDRFMDKLRVERKVLTHLRHNSLAQILTSNPYFKRFEGEIKEMYGLV